MLLAMTSPVPQVIPCVDIQSGRAVRLYEGDPDRETVYFDSPLAAARHWADLGAGFLHLVDLDAATGRGENRAVIAEIVRELGVPIKFIGVGEQPGDLQPFDSREFVRALFDVDIPRS